MVLFLASLFDMCFSTRRRLSIVFGRLDMLISSNDISAIRILSVNRMLHLTSFSHTIQDHEGLQIMEHFRRILEASRAADSATQARKEVYVFTTHWGWAKGHGSSESAICYRVCITDRLLMKSLAHGRIW